MDELKKSATERRRIKNALEEKRDSQKNRKKAKKRLKSEKKTALQNNKSTKKRFLKKAPFLF